MEIIKQQGLNWGHIVRRSSIACPYKIVVYSEKTHSEFNGCLKFQQMANKQERI